MINFQSSKSIFKFSRFFLSFSGTFPNRNARFCKNIQIDLKGIKTYAQTNFYTVVEYRLCFESFQYFYLTRFSCSFYKENS